MSLINFFTNDSLFPDFDRLFDEAFTARTTPSPGQVARRDEPTTLQALRPR